MMNERGADHLLFSRTEYSDMRPTENMSQSLWERFVASLQYTLYFQPIFDSAESGLARSRRKLKNREYYHCYLFGVCAR